MFESERIFYEQWGEVFRLYQYFPYQGINTQKLILANDIKEEKIAKFMVETLNEKLIGKMVLVTEETK